MGILGRLLDSVRRLVLSYVAASKGFSGHQLGRCLLEAMRSCALVFHYCSARQDDWVMGVICDSEARMTCYAIEARRGEANAMS